ncbi:MAG: hypothetical protein WAK93_21380 [Solirubrobacteraceae bacterium]
MYHLELRQFPHVARAFNLSREELDSRYVRPWVNGTMIEHDDRRWAPDKVRLTVYEGPELRVDEIGLGRGWGSVVKSSKDVTATVLADAERGAEARPEVEALKGAIEEVATNPLSGDDVVVLAAAGHPTWRASEQLALAEQAVWEMLHQGRLTITAEGEPVDQERWQAIVLSWATWSGAADDPLRFQVPAG